MKTKDFWKIVLASALGVLLLTVALSILSGMFMGAIIAGASLSSDKKAVVPANAVLDIDMSTLAITEQTLEDNPFSSLSFSGSNVETVSNVGILDAVNALDAAAADPLIKMAYIRPDMASDIAHLEEFRQALVRFRSSGKPLVAFIQTPTNAGAYLSSAADRTYISNYHGGMNMMVGLSGSMTYLKDLLDLLGVNIQLIRHGKYKSAGEPYIRSTPSEENLEQQRVMITNLWKEIAGPIAEGANMSIDEFNTLIDNLSIVEAADFVKYGLADEAVSLDQMREKLCSGAGVEEYSDIKSISLADYAAIQAQKLRKEQASIKNKIAVIYADGEIVDGRGTEEVAGKRFADIINDIADDDCVKAVVLRVNSPGGSVIASSQIKEALDALRDGGKSVVASYGAYAASGGYWISACSDYIFSDATTLTGSIGVFGMIPDLSNTAKKIAHLNVVPVNSNKHSDMYSFMRALSPEEIGYVQKDIEAIYTQFTSLVAQGRKMSVEEVDNLGQGRVWTGKDALERGLVDRIGGLKSAIEYAESLVGEGSCRIEAYPEPAAPLERLLSAFQPKEDNHLVKIFSEIEKSGQAGIYARLPFQIDIR